MSSSGPTLDPIRVIRQYLWWIVAAMILGGALGVVGHYVLVWKNPVYRATAIFEIGNPNSAGAELGGGDPVSETQVKRDLNTQALNMTQPGVFREAVIRPDVRNTEWYTRFTDANGSLLIDEAVEDLAERVRAVPIGESRLIELSISGSRPDDLLRLLQAVIAVYERRLSTQKQSQTTDAVASLQEQKRQLEERITALDRDIQAYVQEHGVTPTPQTEEAVIKMQQLVQTYGDRQEELRTAASLVEYYESRMDDPDATFSEEELAAAETDRQVIVLDSQIRDLSTQLRSLESQLGARHRHVIALQQQLAAAEAERDIELQRALNQNLQIALNQALNDRDRLAATCDELASEQQRLAARLSDLSTHMQWLESRRTEKADLAERVTNIEEKIAEANLWVQTRNTTPATLKDEPVKPTIPVFPKLTIMIPLGVLLLGGFTTGLIFLREIIDQRVKGPSDVSILAHGRVLGVIPHLAEDPARPARPELVTMEAPAGVTAESIRQVRIRLLRAMDEAGHRTLLIAACTPGGGSSALLSNLAVSIANCERNVLVIDANFRQPNLAEIFGVSAEPGLGDVLFGAVAVEQAIQSTRAERVDLLAVGAPEYRVSERLTTATFASTLAQLRTRYDIILIDGPAAVATGDAMALAHAADASVLVVRASQEERGLVGRLIHQFREARAEHLGVILNAVRAEAGGYFKRNFKQMDAYQRGRRN